MGFKDKIQMLSHTIKFSVQRHLVLIGLVVTYSSLACNFNTEK